MRRPFSRMRRRRRALQQQGAPTHPQGGIDFAQWDVRPTTAQTQIGQSADAADQEYVQKNVSVCALKFGLFTYSALQFYVVYLFYVMHCSRIQTLD